MAACALTALAVGLATLAPAALARAAADVELNGGIEVEIETSQIHLPELGGGAALQSFENSKGATPKTKAAPAKEDANLGGEFWLMLAALTGLGFALRRRSAL